MPVAAIAPIAGLAGSVIGGIFGNSAASAQSDAAKNAAAMQMQQAAQTQRVADLNRADQFPWLATGTNAIGTLSHLMGIAGGPSTTPWSPSYGGTTPGAPSPFMVHSTNGAPGTVPAGKTDVAGAPAVPGNALPNGAVNNRMLPAGTTATDTGQQFGGPPAQAPGNLDMGTAGTAMAQAPGGGGAGAPAAPPTYDPNGQLSGQFSGDGSLAQSWTQAFEAPTNITEQNDPGYQARLKMATDALQNSAAARGNLLTGGTAKDLGNMAQDYASNEYNNVYNRALGQYQQNYNIFNNNQTNLFNRLAALSGAGQVTASNLAGNALQATNQISGNVAQAGNDLQNAAYQRASGYVNTGNAITGGLNNLAGLYSALKGTNGGSSQGGWPTDLSTFGM